MVYTRERYLIQHIPTKQYIRLSTGHNGKLELTSNAWSAWGQSTVGEALHVLETNQYMPEDRESYRIVKTFDQREVEEDEREHESLRESQISP